LGKKYVLKQEKFSSNAILAVKCLIANELGSEIKMIRVILLI